jgi:hypothetical protein
MNKSSTYTSNKVTRFPSQIVSDSRKGKPFHIDCTEAALQMVGTDSSNNNGLNYEDRLRLSRSEMIVNRKLFQDELDPRDMGKLFNPTDNPAMEDLFREVKNFPIEYEYFNLIIGEGTERSFNYRLSILNPEVNELKQAKKINDIYEFAARKIMADTIDQNELQKEIQKKLDGYKYDTRMLEEIRGQMLVDYISELNNFDQLFKDTHWDQLIVGEEIVAFEERGGQLYVDKVHSEDLYIIRSGDSKFIQDADIIVHVTYKSPFTVIEDYKDVLSKNEMVQIDDSYAKDGVGMDEYAPTGFLSEEYRSFGSGLPSGSNGFDTDYTLGEEIRSNGDLRVVRVCWKSFREVKILLTEDDTGNLTKEIVDAKYVPNTEIGETVESIRIPEWRECTKIGKDIYTKWGVFFGNVYSKQDLKLCSSPYIGYVYTTGGTRVNCPMSTIKNYKYTYNLINKEKEAAIGANIGNVLEMDMASIPQSWDVDKVLYWMKVAKLKFVDSFAKDPITGNAAGAYNTTGKQSNLNQIDHIQLYDNILQRIKIEMGETLGITPQRLGQISNRETVGGVERSVVQSSNTTEPLYKAHDYFKKLVKINTMELAKVVYDGQSIPVKNIADGVMQGYITLNGTEYASYDWGIFFSDIKKDTNISQAIKQMAPIMFQNDKLDEEAYIALMEVDDPVVQKKILADSKKEREAINEKRQQEAMELQQQQADEQARREQLQREFEAQKESNKIEADILIREMENQNNLDLQELKNQGSVTDDEADKAHKRSLEERKQQLAEKTQMSKERYDKEKLNIEKKKVNSNKVNK